VEGRYAESSTIGGTSRIQATASGGSKSYYIRRLVPAEVDKAALMHAHFAIWKMSVVKLASGQETDSVERWPA
jgi:hypothetical protein